MTDAAASEDAEAAKPNKQATAGGGGASSSRAGSGGSNARSARARAGAGAQPTAGAAVQAGAPASSGTEADGASGAGSELEAAAGESGKSERGNQAAGSGGVGGAPQTSGREEPSDCELIRTACEAVAAPSDDVTACLSVGESSDASACQARIEDCRQSCGAQLCEQVLNDCPATGEGPVLGCHQIGVTDNAGDCFGDGAECLDFCHMVLTP